ncbi:MAG: glycogen/starch/alpha-glucan family phosphorylase [Bacilli bacterium]
MNIKQLLYEKALKTYALSFKELSPKEKYNVLAAIINDYSFERLQESNQYVATHKMKQVYYFSMEFLMGRMLTNNLMNLGIFDEVDTLLQEEGLSISDLEIEECDAGLGNGGLGRLAACFLDSLASNKYPGHGITIRYRNGFFKQKFINNEQVELPDLWLIENNMWEQKVISDICEVSYYGDVITKEENDKITYETINDLRVNAIPYDMPIVGANTKLVNTLRMYDIAPVSNYVYGQPYYEYEKEIMDITSCLYPDDSTSAGLELRVKQQYFFVCAGLNNIIKRHLSIFNTLDNFHEYNVLQINDTHPTLLIPEMMRILIDYHDYAWQDAFNITSKCIAYTNHTILAEALEKWDLKMFKKLLPRIYIIIEQINEYFVKQLKHLNYNDELINQLLIIKDGQVHMAHLAIMASFSVNGVAALHTQILKEKTMAKWHQLYPTKFNNKTNGITQRRWLEHCNPALTNYLSQLIGNEFKTNPVTGFKKLLDYINNDDVINNLALIKHTNKIELKQYILLKEGLEIDENAIFDIQVKRLHAYKRQSLNILHIIYLYLQLKNNPSFKANFHPQTFFFGAKAAPSYVFAKNCIKLINTVSEIINNDHDVNHLLKVIMVENYNVSYAQKLIPAADVSQQISTAGFEASGTGNMKFMMTGALTIGTLDGANVEIDELVGRDNIYIFGLNKNEVNEIKNNNEYQASILIENDQDLNAIFTFINEIDQYHPQYTNKDFKAFVDAFILENDYYLVLQDFKAYKEAQATLNQEYKDQKTWQNKALINIAMSGFFSSDRSIEDYVNDIWHLKKVDL